MYELSPRDFELLVADLLSDMGWRVEVTPITRDGGKDILAYLDTDIGSMLCLVEAKRFKCGRPVGVEVVRSLYGTFCDYGANSAMLVTTSSFTADAYGLSRRHKYQLALKDYVDLKAWISRYGGRP